MTIQQWAARWSIPQAALDDLTHMLTDQSKVPPPIKGTSEAAAQVEVRLDAARKGVFLLRNNVGVLLDQRGVPVRFGLANESKAENAHIKSSDLIGWRPVVITQAHVGSTIAQFVSREVKHVGWRWRGDDHEQAQLRWLMLVLLSGGDAAFATGRGTL